MYAIVAELKATTMNAEACEIVEKCRTLHEAEEKLSDLRDEVTQRTSDLKDIVETENGFDARFIIVTIN